VFQGTAFGGSGTYVAYLWTFGDDGVGSGADLQHRFNFSGNYTVHLTVWDTANATADSSVVIAVGPSNTSAPAGASGGAAFPTVLVLAGLAIGGVATITAVALARWVALRRRERGMPIDAGGTVADPPDPPFPADPPERPEEVYGGPFVAPPVDRAAIAAPVDPPPPGPAGLPVPEVAPVFAARRALAQRLILELSTVPREWDRSVAPALATQAGLAGRLGVQQSAISKVLRGLEAAAIVRSEIGHAHGASRRVRVYALTDRGERAARALQLATAPEPDESFRAPRADGSPTSGDSRDPGSSW